MTDFVLYAAGKNKVRAAVRRRYKDGGVVVEPFFFVDDGGRDVGPFIGGRVSLRKADYDAMPGDAR